MESDGMDDIKRRHESMLARLSGRHPGKTFKTVSESKEQDASLDLLIDRARCEVASGSVSPDITEQLERFLEVCTGRAHVRISDVLSEIRKLTLANSKQKKSAFSFSSKKEAKPMQKVISSDLPTILLRSEEPEEKMARITPENALNLRDLKNVSRTVEGKDGKDVTIKDVEDCQLSFAFRPSAVHIIGIKRTKLVFLPVDTSILMHDCEDVNMWADAQQIRVHTSHRLVFHVSVRGAIIIEGCKQVQLAPYRLRIDDVEVKASDDVNWRKVSDFDWLAEGPSPNWTLAPEQLNTVAHITTT